MRNRSVSFVLLIALALILATGPLTAQPNRLFTFSTAPASQPAPVALSGETAVVLPVAPVAPISTPLAASSVVLPPEAQAACQRYEASVSRAYELFVREMKPARDKLVIDLQLVQVQITKTGNLDAAVKIRDTVERLKAMPLEPPVLDGASDERARLAARVRDSCWRRPDGDRGLWFFADMTVRVTHYGGAEGNWAPISADTFSATSFYHKFKNTQFKLSADGRQLSSSTGGVYVLVETNPRRQ